MFAEDENFMYSKSSLILYGFALKINSKNGTMMIKIQKNIKKYFQIEKKCLDKLKKGVYNMLVN